MTRHHTRHDAVKHARRFDKRGALRIWRIISMPGEPEFWPVKDIEHAVALMNAMADSDLLDDTIQSNAYGLEVFTDGDWEEWESILGEDISELAKQEPWQILEAAKDHREKFQP